MFYFCNIIKAFGFEIKNECETKVGLQKNQLIFWDIKYVIKYWEIRFTILQKQLMSSPIWLVSAAIEPESRNSNALFEFFQSFVWNEVPVLYSWTIAS